MKTKKYREVKLTDRFPNEFGRYNFKAKNSDIFVGDNYMKIASKQEYLDRYESWLEEYDSKASEMLEMLNKIAKDNLWGSDDDYRKLKQLINEATKI